MPAALLPGDITLDLYCGQKLTGLSAIFTGEYFAPSYYSTIKNLGPSWEDLKVQSFNLTLDLERKPLHKFGYKVPLDKRIEFPVFANISVDAEIGDSITGSAFTEFLNYDDYYVTVKMRNPLNSRYVQGVAVQYDMLRAKLISSSFSSSIGPNKTVNFNFRTELDPDDLSRGLFISGLLNIDLSDLNIVEDIWVTETPENVIDDDGNNVLVSPNYIVFY